jgi:hypothetical protein
MLRVITGPPCSGKTTYVRNHAQPGDIVIDFDTLAQALGSPVSHDHDPHVRNITIAMRRTAIDAAIKAHHSGATVWIVDCNITTWRVTLYTQAKAEIIVIPFDRGELHKRATLERPPLWHRLIDGWAPPTGLPAATYAGNGTGESLAASSREW